MRKFLASVFMGMVFISGSHVQQADTLLVAAKTEQKPSGTLGGVPLHFFQDSNKTWIAIPGIAVNKAPGVYVLRIVHQLVKNIVVSKRKFPVAVLASVPGFTAKKIVSTIENKENAALKKVLAAISDKPYSAKPFINPLAEMKVVGDYGDIRKSGKLSIQHLGVDLKAAVGTPVLAVNDGKVVFEKSLPDYGNTLVIDHGLGVYSLYLHLSQFNVAEGDMVAQGQTVALSGDTGYVTGPHLHFSIKMRGASVDPLKFLETTNIKY